MKLRTVTMRDRTEFGQRFPYPKTNEDMDKFAEIVTNWIVQDFAGKHTKYKMGRLQEPFFYVFPLPFTQQPEMNGMVKQLELEGAKPYEELLQFAIKDAVELEPRTEGELHLELPGSWSELAAEPIAAEYLYTRARSILATNSSAHVVVGGLLCRSTNGVKLHTHRKTGVTFFEWTAVAVGYPPIKDLPESLGVPLDLDYGCARLTDREGAVVLHGNSVVAFSALPPKDLYATSALIGSQPDDMVLDLNLLQPGVIAYWSGEHNNLTKGRKQELSNAITKQVQEGFNPYNLYARFTKEGNVCSLPPL